MFTKLSKYFSLFLILFLVNSNYSFALTHMLCKMNNTLDACECDQNSGSDEIQFKSMDAGCCKVETSEINNRNTLESNKISLDKEITFKKMDYFDESILLIDSFKNSKIILNHFHPPSEIPILFSHILI